MHGLRLKTDARAIDRRIAEIEDLLDGGPDRAGECDTCHREGGVWLDGESEDCGDWQFCRGCLGRELTRLRALKRMRADA